MHANLSHSALELLISQSSDKNKSLFTMTRNIIIHRKMHEITECNKYIAIPWNGTEFWYFPWKLWHIRFIKKKKKGTGACPVWKTTRTIAHRMYGSSINGNFMELSGIVVHSIDRTAWNCSKLHINLIARNSNTFHIDWNFEELLRIVVHSIQNVEFHLTVVCSIYMKLSPFHANTQMHGISVHPTQNSISWNCLELFYIRHDTRNPTESQCVI